MAQRQPRASEEAESALRRHLGLDFPTGTKFITLRHTWGQRRLTAWLFRWPEADPLPPRPLPFCELCQEGEGRPLVTKLERSDFGLDREEMRRVGGLVTTVPVYYGSNGWAGMPRSWPWDEHLLALLAACFGERNERQVEEISRPGWDYRDWLDALQEAVHSRGGTAGSSPDADLQTKLLLTRSGYLPERTQTVIASHLGRAEWIPAGASLAIVQPETCVVLARDASATVDLLVHLDGELVALVSHACWLWRTVYGAGVTYVPLDKAVLDTPAWVANSDAVLRAAEIKHAWRDDLRVPVAARSAANFLDRMEQTLPLPALLDAIHNVDTTELGIVFRLLPVYTPWMEADLTAVVGDGRPPRDPPRPVVALHAGWSGMADWATEFLHRREGPDRRKLVDRLQRDGI